MSKKMKQCKTFYVNIQDRNCMKDEIKFEPI